MSLPAVPQADVPKTLSVGLHPNGTAAYVRPITPDLQKPAWLLRLLQTGTISQEELSSIQKPDKKSEHTSGNPSDRIHLTFDDIVKGFEYTSGKGEFQVETPYDRSCVVSSSDPFKARVFFIISEKQSHLLIDYLPLSLDEEQLTVVDGKIYVPSLQERISEYEDASGRQLPPVSPNYNIQKIIIVESDAKNDSQKFLFAQPSKAQLDTKDPFSAGSSHNTIENKKTAQGNTPVLGDKKDGITVHLDTNYAEPSLTDDLQPEDFIRSLRQEKAPPVQTTKEGRTELDAIGIVYLSDNDLKEGITHTSQPGKEKIVIHAPYDKSFTISGSEPFEAHVFWTFRDSSGHKLNLMSRPSSDLDVAGNKCEVPSLDTELQDYELRYYTLQPLITHDIQITRVLVLVPKNKDHPGVFAFCCPKK